MEKKRWAGLGAGVLALAVAAGTFAYYTNTQNIDNQMKTLSYGSTLREEFTPSNNWQPGQEANKVVSVKNTGDYDLVVRVKLSETWTRSEEEEAFKTIDSTAGASKITTTKQESATDGLTANDDTVVTKTMDDGTYWTLGDDGYWYYNAVLEPGSTTESLLSKIQLLKDADMGKFVVTKYYTESSSVKEKDPGTDNVGSDPSTHWVVYSGDAAPTPSNEGNTVYTFSRSQVADGTEGYSDAVYSLVIQSEICQATADAVAATFTSADEDIVAAWGLS